MTEQGIRLDYFAMLAVGEPYDVGWGTVMLNADQTVTKTCKGCGRSVTTPIVGTRAHCEFIHADNCTVFDRIGNNASLS